jgi:nucleotide-binding universal stress UspA family protein
MWPGISMGPGSGLRNILARNLGADMTEGLKDILIAVTKEHGPDETSSALSYGVSLAQQANAHATVEAASVRLVLTSFWVSDFAADLISSENRRLERLADTVARTTEGNAAAAGVVTSVNRRRLSYPELLGALTEEARLYDLTILDAEPEPLTLDRGLFEALLMRTGRPVLVVPPGRESFSLRRASIAWDGSARAARALNDALPLLRKAEEVQILAVTGEKDLPSAVNGADIAPHLARHGVKATVSCVPARDGDVAQTLRDAATLFRADMLVMGGYVHSRLREYIFGGVTQSLLKTSPVPLFMSH